MLKVPNRESIKLQGGFLIITLIIDTISSFWSAVHVEAFCDLNILPKYGCCEINLVASSVVCPNLAVYIVYSSVFDITQNAYSIPFCKNTGLVNVNLVASEASVDTVMSAASIVFSADGKTVVAG